MCVCVFAGDAKGYLVFFEYGALWSLRKYRRLMTWDERKVTSSGFVNMAFRTLDAGDSGFSKLMSEVYVGKISGIEM